MLDRVNQCDSDLTYTIRNGKQCRERWLTALDPNINKSQWSTLEDIDFLEKWMMYGNKWREIATMINGRTESQVKNRFKLILRREQIHQAKIDPKELRDAVIPKVIENLKSALLEGKEVRMSEEDSGEDKQRGSHQNEEDSRMSSPERGDE